jgi:hypothetical protein
MYSVEHIFISFAFVTHSVVTRVNFLQLGKISPSGPDITLCVTVSRVQRQVKCTVKQGTSKITCHESGKYFPADKEMWLVVVQPDYLLQHAIRTKR